MKKYSGLPYIVLIGLAKKIGGEVKLSEEHSDYAWVKPKKALTHNLTSETEKALLVLKETFPKLKN